MSESDLLQEAFTDLVGDWFGAEAVMAAESEALVADAWAAVAESGFAAISLPESAGGSGGSLAQALSLLPVLGRQAVPLPVAESGVLAGWLCAGAGLPLAADGHLTVAEGGERLELERAGSDRLRVSGTLSGVPWGGSAEAVVTVADFDGRPLVLRLPQAKLAVTQRRSLAGEPRDEVSLASAVLRAEDFAEAGQPDPAAALRLRGGLVRTLQMTGALERVAALTLDYARVREQFGRPIARFQAVAHHLAELSEQVALAGTAAAVAAELYAAGSDDAPLTGEPREMPAAGGSVEAVVAMARIVTARAAGQVSRLAHQIHGAIGTTREYPLHLYTRRLWSWTDEFGSAAWWARYAGDRPEFGDPNRHWGVVTAGLHRAG